MAGSPSRFVDVYTLRTQALSNPNVPTGLSIASQSAFALSPPFGAIEMVQAINAGDGYGSTPVDYQDAMDLLEAAITLSGNVIQDGATFESRAIVWLSDINSLEASFDASGPSADVFDAIAAMRATIASELTSYEGLADTLEPGAAPHSFTNLNGPAPQGAVETLEDSSSALMIAGGTGADGAYNAYRTEFAAKYTAYPGNPATDPITDLFSYWANVAPGN